MTDTVEITTLGNGLRVVSEHMPRLQTASLGVWVDVGTRYEPAEVNGVAHLLEHMAFKGTARRSARAIAEEIERVGGSLNAYTSREHTAYYARILADDVELAADILADILRTRPSTRPSWRRSATSSCRRSARSRTRPTTSSSTCCRRRPTPTSRWAAPSSARRRSSQGMPREALIDYMAPPLRPQAPGVRRRRQDRARPAGRPRPAPVRRPAAAAEPGRAEPARYSGGTRVERRPDLEQVHLCLAVEGLPYHHPDHFALQVLSTALGGGMSSRLFQEARENRGLCYSIFSFASAYADTGQLGVYAGTDPEDVPELMQVVADETRAADRGARRGRDRPRPRPAQGQPADGPGELLGRVRGPRPPAPVLRPPRARPRRSWPRSTRSTPPPSAASAASCWPARG